MTEELKPRQATPEDKLREHLMDPRIAKTEVEWFAAREIKRLEELLATRSPAWRDIESAPRDGDDPECLAWVDGIVEKVYWDGHGFVLDNEAWRGGPTQYVEPTHWMPLPQPPEEGRG